MFADGLLKGIFGFTIPFFFCLLFITCFPILYEAEYPLNQRFAELAIRIL